MSVQNDNACRGARIGAPQMACAYAHLTHRRRLSPYCPAGSRRYSLCGDTLAACRATCAWGEYQRAEHDSSRSLIDGATGWGQFRMIRSLRQRFPALRTLRARLMLALAVGSILPLVIVGIGAAILQQQAIAGQANRDLTVLGRGLAAQLDQVLGGVLRDARPSRHSRMSRARFRPARDRPSASCSTTGQSTSG